MKQILYRLVFALFISPFFVWGVLSLWYGSWSPLICMVLSVLYGLAVTGVIYLAPFRRLLPMSLAVFLIPLISFFLMKPSHEREWQADATKMPYAKINSDNIVIHNVRNCDYTTEIDYVPHFESRTYDLSKLKSVDLLLTDWGLTYIAHTMISFGFEDEQYLCLSIETRKEKGESYSAIKGFFRQYELIYILADEKDLVRLRTNYRKGENVYLYRLRIASLERARRIFIEILNRVNSLHEQPEWYNALTENCMTSGFRIARKHAAPGRGKWHWSIILNGLADKNAYLNHTIDTSLPFGELKKISRINNRAMATDDASDFSTRIRNGLPGMDWMPPDGE